MSIFKTARRAALAAALVLSAAAAPCAPVTYTIVSKLSRVSFSLEHQGFIQLFGTLRMAPGSFSFDDEDWKNSSIAVSMPTRSLDMGDATWNQQIRDDDAWAKLFKSPTVSFRSTKLERMDATHGTLAGELTLAGVTKPVLLQLRFNKLGLNQISKLASVGFSATTTIKRSEYGLNAYSDLVGDELAVQIQIEAAAGADGDARNKNTANGVKR